MIERDRTPNLCNGNGHGFLKRFVRLIDRLGFCVILSRLLYVPVFCGERLGFIVWNNYLEDVGYDRFETVVKVPSESALGDTHDPASLISGQRPFASLMNHMERIAQGD